MLPMIWFWDMSPVDACGFVETPGVHAIVTQLQTEPAGFLHICMNDPETGEEGCHDDVIYQPVDVLAEDLVDQAWYPDDLVFAPPLGGVTFVDVGAEDLAGNRDGACP